MKTISYLSAVKAAAVASCALAVSSGNLFAAPGNGNGNNTPQMIPAVPNGWLSAYPTIVQTGTKPTLTWSMTHPSTVANHVTISSPATVTTTGQLDVDIRVIGAGVTSGGCSGNNTNWVPTQALISVSGGSYLSIFNGTNLDVRPNALVWAKRVNSGTVFRFGGRYKINNTWSQTYNSTSGGNNIRVLKNGEFPPTAYPLHTSGDLKSFMAPYLDGGGRIKIGPLDLIVMMELTQPDSNVNNPCYNLQDMVLLVTAKPKGNNGHGNNIDGVDSSNPGNSKPVDPSGTVDDERRR